MAGLRFGHDSAMALCARVVQASSPSIPVCRAPPSLPFPKGVSSQPRAELCLGLLSRPHIPAPSPFLQRWTPSQAGWAGLGAVPVCRSPLSCCLWLLPCSPPTEDEDPLPSQLGSPSEGLPQRWRPLLSSDLPRFAGPIPLPFLFFFFLLSFALPSSAGIFLVLLDFQGPLLVFSWAL